MDDDLGTAFFWLAILCGVVVWANWDRDNIVGHLRHQIANGVSYSKVLMQPRPRDCDFWGAPVGIKDCSYKPVVTAYDAAGQVVQRNGKPTSDGELIRDKSGKLVISYGDVGFVDVQWARVAN